MHLKSRLLISINKWHTHIPTVCMERNFGVTHSFTSITTKITCIHQNVKIVMPFELINNPLRKSEFL